MARCTIEELLASARRGLVRLDPQATVRAVAQGAILVDIRSEAQRARDGVVPGAIHHPRNVLEWRADPTSESRDVRIAGYDRHLVLLCDEGYQSSLAAATLQQLGLERTTDVVGGFQAWRAAGLPVKRLDGG